MSEILTVCAEKKSNKLYPSPDNYSLKTAPLQRQFLQRLAKPVPLIQLYIINPCLLVHVYVITSFLAQLCTTTLLSTQVYIINKLKVFYAQASPTESPDHRIPDFCLTMWVFVFSSIPGSTSQVCPWNTAR